MHHIGPITSFNITFIEKVILLRDTLHLQNMIHSSKNPTELQNVMTEMLVIYCYRVIVHLKHFGKWYREFVVNH